MTRFHSAALPVALVVVAVAAGMWLWQREQALRQYESEVNVTSAANRRFQRTLFAQLQSRRVAVAAAAKRAPASGSAVNSSTPARAALANNTAVLAILKQLPEYAPYLHARYERWTMEEYGEWFRQLNVPPARLALLKRAVAGVREKRQNAYEALLDTGVDRFSEGFKESYKRITDAEHADLQQVFTAEEYTSYSNFEKALDWVGYVPEIQAYLEDRGVPALTADQKRMFIDACNAASEFKPDRAGVAPGVRFRMKNEWIAASAGAAWGSAQRQGIADYIAFFNQRSRLMGELRNPSDPDAIALIGWRSF